MKMIIEARLVDDVTECPPVHLATIDRELTTDTLGLSLAEGKAILSSAQRYFVSEQCRGIAWSHSCCEGCGVRLGRKGHHDRHKQLHGAQVLRTPVDQGGLGSPYRVGAVVGRVQAKFLDPAFEDSTVLARAKMGRVVNTAREQEVLGLQPFRLYPRLHCVSGSLRDLELNGSLGLML